MPAGFPSFCLIGTRIRRAEALGVAHRRPGVGLNVGQHLAQMVGVVVDPLVQEVIDGQEPAYREVSVSVEVDGRQCLHECDA